MYLLMRCSLKMKYFFLNTCVAINNVLSQTCRAHFNTLSDRSVNYGSIVYQHQFYCRHKTVTNQPTALKKVNANTKIIVNLTQDKDVM